MDAVDHNAKTLVNHTRTNVHVHNVVGEHSLCLLAPPKRNARNDEINAIDTHSTRVLHDIYIYMCDMRDKRRIQLLATVYVYAYTYANKLVFLPCRDFGRVSVSFKNLANVLCALGSHGNWTAVHGMSAYIKAILKRGKPVEDV